MLRVPQIILFYVCLLKTIKKFVWRNQVKTYNDIIREENAFIEIRSLLLKKKMILDFKVLQALCTVQRFALQFNDILDKV